RNDVELRDLETGKVQWQRRLSQAPSSFVALAFHPSGKYVAGSGGGAFWTSEKPEVGLWNVETGEQVWLHYASASALSFTPDGKHLVMAGRLTKNVHNAKDQATTVAILDSSTGAIQGVFRGFREIDSLRVNADGKGFVVSSYDPSPAVRADAGGSRWSYEVIDAHAAALP